MANFPGFDSGSYPGDHVMENWFGNPYVFTGYYLEAPCHNANKFKPWAGHMNTLKQIGWGFVVCYVGRQAAGCGSDKLTRAHGLTDAQDAITKAKNDAMDDEGTIFLDIERMEDLNEDMVHYMRGWIRGLLDDGTYSPGVYAHFHNAVDLFNEARKEYADVGQANGAPAFWIVRVPGGNKFNVLTSGPQDLTNLSPSIPFASVWQGKIDLASETHNDVKFGPVDQNVADSPNPSKA